MSADQCTGDAERLEIQEVADKNGVKKSVVGWPTGLRKHRLPTGVSDLDYRCPSCEDVGFVDRLNRESKPTCTNRSCRVNRFSPFVDEINDAYITDTERQEADR